MRKAYFAISYANRKLFDNIVERLENLLKKYDIELFIFVDKYNFKSNQEKEMMETAFNEIDSSDFLIAELTTKSIGVGIEIGYAFAKNKPIYYIYKNGSEYSTTASGSSNYIIEYKDELDLIETMKERLKLTAKI